MKIILVVFVALFLVGCNADKHPTYEELKSENDQLKSQLSAVNEEVQQAKSDLEDLKNEIESGGCYDEDSASGMADDIESALEQADEDSQY